MELLDGATLDAIVGADGAQDPARVVRVLAMACGALSEAHGLGLIHRDIKPANSMLCSQGNVLDIVKVLDFGLVKQMESERNLRLSAANSIAVGAWGAQQARDWWADNEASLRARRTPAASGRRMTMAIDLKRQGAA